LVPRRQDTLHATASDPASTSNSPTALYRRRRGEPAKPRIDTGATRAMPADRAERVCNELLGVLREEWKRIRTSNLGGCPCPAWRAALHA
jgi:hypothetical protein